MSTKITLKPYEYYYDFNKQTLATLKDMKYEEALHYKITSAKNLQKRLVESFNYLDRDNQRISDIGKAINFNQQLLKEVSYD